MNVELLEEDANSTVKMVQMKSFGEKNKCSKFKLRQQSDFFLDSNGLLRVGSRLGKSSLSNSEGHPLVSPK